MDALEQFQYLTYMALADGTLQKEEKPLLKKLGKRLGLSSEAMNEVLTAQKNELKLPKKLPKDPAERRALFKNLCRMALADDEVASKEKTLLTKVGKSIGMDKKEVEEYLERRLEKSGEAKRHSTEKEEKGPRKPALGFSNTDYFQCLAYMAVADGELQDEVTTLLKKYGKRLELSTEEMKSVLSSQKKKPSLPSQLPEDKSQRQSLFKAMAKIALADHELSKRELRLMTKVGEAFGMDQSEVQGFIDNRLGKQEAPPKAADPVSFEARDSFRYLCSMALADGVLDDEEVVILQKFGAQLGLSPEQRQEILNEQNRSKDPVELPDSEDERQKLFRQVSKMALADEDVAAEEFLILARIGKSIGMDKKEVESFLKKELKKQIQRASSKEQVEASKLRSTGLKLVAVVVLVIALIGAYKALEKTDKKFDALKQAVATLDSEAELSQFQELKTRIEDFQSASPIAKVKEQANTLLDELKARKKAHAVALGNAATLHMDSDRSDSTWRAKTLRFLEKVNEWKNEAPGELTPVAESLQSALEQGSLWEQWGRKVLREAHAHWPDNELHKQVFKISKAVMRQPVTVETFQEKLRKAEGQGTDAILLLVADIQYHPYLPQSYYQRRAAEARDMLNKDLGKRHRDELIAFASRLKSCLVIGEAYKIALKKSMKAAQEGQKDAALGAFTSSLYSQDAWFKAVITWLKSDTGLAFVALQKK